MITRLWHGWTTQDNADRYERLIGTEIFPGILARKIGGLNKLELHRRSLDHEVEFITAMRFSSMAAVEEFAGPEWEVSVVPQKARALLSRFDAHAQHYEVRVEEEVLSPGRQTGIEDRC